MNTTTVYHIVIHSPEHSKVVQQRLIELGYTWPYSTPNEVQFLDSKSLQLNFNGPSVLTRSNRTYPAQTSNKWRQAKIITLDDLYGPEFCQPTSIEVTLNATHKAVVSKDKIVVGCQIFEPSIITALAEAHKKVSQ